MKDKTALKSAPKPEATPDILEEYLAKRMLPDIARKNADLLRLAGEFADPVLVERWDLQQVFDLLYSIELILEQWRRTHDEEAVDIFYICKPLMNQFTALFDPEANLGRVLIHGRERRV